MVGVVILNYNSWEDTRECMESIFEYEQACQMNIYLVDNNSSIRPSAEMCLFMEKKHVVFLQSKENKGYAAGNNIGIAKALKDGCDAILISNSDVRYERCSISIMYQYLQEHPGVGIVGPKIKLQNGQTQKECMAIKTGMKEKYLLRTRLKILFPKLNKQYWAREWNYEHEIFPVYAVLGCSFMISRTCALDVTPLDEHTFLYEEELILGIRMEKAGWKTMYNPQSVVLHKHEATTGGIRSNPFAYTCQVCSEIYYCKQYLKMKRWSIYPLYFYRVLLYYCCCLKVQAFRRYHKNFINISIEELRE